MLGKPRDEREHPPTIKAADGETVLMRFYVDGVMYAPNAPTAERQLEQANIYLDDAVLAIPRAWSFPAYRLVVFRGGSTTAYPVPVDRIDEAVAAAVRLLGKTEGVDVEARELVREVDRFEGATCETDMPDGRLYLTGIDPTNSRDREELALIGLVVDEAVKA